MLILTCSAPSSPMAAKTTKFQTEGVPLFLYTYNCKPVLVKKSTSDETSEKRKGFSSPGNQNQNHVKLRNLKMLKLTKFEMLFRKC